MISGLKKIVTSLNLLYYF